MNSFRRRDFLRGFTALAGTSFLPSLVRLAQGQTANTSATAPKAQMARGRVTLGQNGTGIPNVRVSNGREIVTTDAQGRYELPVMEDTIIFIQKPAGYQVSLNELNQPEFYYIHKPMGTQGKARFPGIAPTGELPESVDFNLIKEEEPNDFRVLLWGDPQPRNIKEVDFVARDVASELVGVDAAFGLCLGDNSFNNLSLFRPIQDVTASLGIPWHSIIGNHDLNLDAPDESLSAETFKSHFGPTYYSFDYGQAHFVALDNVLWHGGGTPKGNGNYTRGFTEQQLTWLKNDLAGVSNDKLVVLFMHIPISRAGDDREAVFNLLKDHPHTLSVSGHTHVQSHAFLGSRDGWSGRDPHHHFNCGTVSGSWWSGYPDEVGIPHTTMGDGTPNGYAFLNVNKNEYTIDWKCARASSNYQMNVTVPAPIEAAKAEENLVKVNVFNGSAKTRVEARIGQGKWAKMDRVSAPDPGYANFKVMEDAVPAFAPDAPDALKKKAPWIALPVLVEARIGQGKWAKMDRVSAPDPGYANFKVMEDAVPAFAPDAPDALKKKAPWIALPVLGNTPHLWQMALPSLPVGAHWIEIRATDHWNRTFVEKRLVQVV